MEVSTGESGTRQECRQAGRGWEMMVDASLNNSSRMLLKALEGGGEVGMTCFLFVKLSHCLTKLYSLVFIFKF